MQTLSRSQLVVETPELRLPVGQIAASEAQHLSALTISAASTALDVFES
jgi:hypothetical protein